MKGRIFLFLFGLPFFGVGAWMGYSIGANLADAQQMKQWVAVEGTLRRAGYETHTGDDSNTYEVFAEYSYEFGGRQYSGDRVGISGGSDNIGEYHRDMGRYLDGLRSRGQSVTVYVDPDEPSQSILDRSVRWGLIGFKSIFFFVFGGAGLGLIIFAVRSTRKADPSDSRFQDAPWLANDKWQTAEIRSDSKTSMWVGWGFAAFWNLISAPLPFVIYAEVTEKNNLLALLGLVFPLVGIGLIAWALRQTLEWKRFGAAPVKLDPFPGSIGGHVGGTIDLNLPYDAGARFSMTLTSLRSYVSGTGKNRSRRERAEWQDTQLAHVAPGMTGSRLSFRFDVPEHLRESDADQSEESYYLWRLNLKGDLAGIDIDRSYEIPVYATGRESTALSEISIEQARSEQSKMDRQVVGKLVNLTYDAGGPTLHFPMGRNLFGGSVGVLIGAIFAGAGWYLVSHEGHPIMGGVFGLVGLLIVVASLYSILNSLTVFQDGDRIRTVRRVLGIPMRRQQMRRSDIVGLKKKASAKTNSGKRHVIYYSISAIDGNGGEMVVGEGFKGSSQADEAAGFIAGSFGLTSGNGARDQGTAAGEYDLLTAD